MNLTRKQKKYLKKNLKRHTLAQIAAKLGTSEKELLDYLRSLWRKEKYQKFLAQQDQPQTNILTISFVKNWSILFFLALLILVVYFNALSNEFLSDDLPAIVHNPDLGKLSHVFANPLGFLRPLIYFFNYKIAGLSPVFFHLTNLVFHLGATWLAYLLVVQIVNPTVGILAAAIFAVHPILTESVTWISGGVHAQYSFFVLLALLAYVYSSKNKKLYGFSIFAFILALVSSEKAIILPVLIFLFMVSFEKLSQKWPKLIPFFTIGGFYGLTLFTKLGQRATVLETQFYGESGFTNPLIQIPIAVASYLQLIFWPKNLTLYQSEMSFSQIEYLARLGVFILFLVATAVAFKKNRPIFFWLSFFIVSLLPTLTPLRVSWIVAERYVYLGSLGIVAVFALFLKTLGQKVSNQKVTWICLVLVFFLLGARTVVRNIDWKNQDNLWLATAKTSPSSPQNHNNLGDLYGRRGDLKRAVEEFQKAIELKPGYADAYHNLANTYQQMGEIDLAIFHYQKAIEFNPLLWQSYQNLAAIYYEKGDLELAEEYLKKAKSLQ